MRGDTNAMILRYRRVNLNNISTNSRIVDRGVRSSNTLLTNKLKNVPKQGAVLLRRLRNDNKLIHRTLAFRRILINERITLDLRCYLVGMRLKEL